MTDDKVNSLVRIVLGLLAEEMVKNIGFREKLIGELAEHIDLEGKVNASMTHAVEEQVVQYTVPRQTRWNRQNEMYRTVDAHQSVPRRRLEDRR